MAFMHPYDYEHMHAYEIEHRLKEFDQDNDTAVSLIEFLAGRTGLLLLVLVVTRRKMSVFEIVCNTSFLFQ